MQTLSFGSIVKRGMSTSHAHMLKSMPFYAMKKPTIINVMRVMTLDHTIPLEEVHRAFPNITKLYRGRPEMLLMKMKNGRNVQLFRGGKAQILGRVNDADAASMRLECVEKLQTMSTMRQVRVTTMNQSNLVISVRLEKALSLQKIASIDSDFFYETELFPAALIRTWHPVHISVFHTGTLIFTGLKSVKQLDTLLPDVISCLKSKHIL